jgi:hypothetical protein
MSLVDQQIRSDRRHKLASGIVMPLMMPAAVFAVTRVLHYPAAVLVFVCVGVALAAFGLYRLLVRLFLRKLTLKQQAIAGAIGWAASVPALFIMAKFYLFR